MTSHANSQAERLLSLISRIPALSACICLLIAGAPSNAATRVLLVTNDGVDSAGCGAKTQPCRSISRAIALANAGDTIQVGAGVYGDLNHNARSDSGDEQNTPQCGVCIDKPVAIYSRYGAEVTTIVAPSTSAVQIAASGVKFGAKGHGFTLKGIDNGLIVIKNASNVSVGGNLAIGNFQYGIAVFSSGTSVRISDNRILNSDYGIYLFPPSNSVVENNIAQSCDIDGFFLQGTGLRISGNIAAHTGLGSPDPRFFNEAGFYVEGTNVTIDGNKSVGNRGPGWTIGNEISHTSVRSFTHNSVAGNGGPGLMIRHLATVQNFQFNNIYGNNATIPEVTGSTLQNCGVSNETGATVYASNNFWGSPRGPGADPADNAGPACDVAGGNTISVPFATQFQ